MRERFFESLFEDIQRLPNKFAFSVDLVEGNDDEEQLSSSSSSSNSQNSNPNPYTYKRPKRTIPVLPLAPAPPPPPQPNPSTTTASQGSKSVMQEENDLRTLAVLKYRLGPIVGEMKRRFKRFTKRVVDEYKEEECEAFEVVDDDVEGMGDGREDGDSAEVVDGVGAGHAETNANVEFINVPNVPNAPGPSSGGGAVPLTLNVDVDMNVVVVEEPPHLSQHPQPPAVMVNGRVNAVNGIDGHSERPMDVDESQQLAQPALLLHPDPGYSTQPNRQPTPNPASHNPTRNPTPIPNPNPNPNPLPKKRKFYNIDLEKIHERLYRSYYLTPFELLADVRKIVRNAELVVYGLCMQETTRTATTATATTIATANERWYKAQAMLTMAEVSVGDVVDPFLREACERVRGRERDRIERKERERKEREQREERETTVERGMKRARGESDGGDDRGKRLRIAEDHNNSTAPPSTPPPLHPPSGMAMLLNPQPIPPTPPRLNSPLANPRPHPQPNGPTQRNDGNPFLVDSSRMSMSTSPLPTPSLLPTVNLSSTRLLSPIPQNHPSSSHIQPVALSSSQPSAQQPPEHSLNLHQHHVHLPLLSHHPYRPSPSPHASSPNSGPLSQPTQQISLSEPSNTSV
ncbi:hypothetical protein C8R42DRAFT_729024 [Lentinula raphanica]|nr:hypothetical protein C8R42DRAFT_729024 [Lentinula raphanica]